MKWYSFFLIAMISFLVLMPMQRLAEAQPSKAYIPVPHYYQVKSYYCGPAALEMVFDYYGADVSQYEIADVARTSDAGTFTSDMIRAAHFSNLSTSVGRESPLNFTGYTTRKLGYATFERGGMTIEELKSLIGAGYPIIVLVDWHFRVAVGYNSTYITFQDSLWPPNLNKTYSDFDFEWDYSGHWGLFVSPWKVNVSNVRNVQPGEVFNVTATVTYPWAPPFPKDQYPASEANATISIPDGLTLVSGQTQKKTIGTGNLMPGDSVNVTWTVEAENIGNYVIQVEAEGKITGYDPPVPPDYPEYYYEDRIGGTDQSIVAVTAQPDNSPPVTSNDYDGLWHTQNFKINLTGTDDLSGIMETYYRINNGSIKTASLDGNPYIQTDSANNTLEYWSEDWAGNEETPHKMLNGIKLDKSPPTGSILINENATYVNSAAVALTLSAVDATSGVAQMRFSNNQTTWSSWETYNTSKIWELASTDGKKKVYAQFINNVGLISNASEDEIILDTVPPVIGIPTRIPEGDVLPEQEVKVSVNVTDSTSHVTNVTLSYNLNNSAVWIDLSMIFNSTTSLYEATIPRQNISTFVKYMIVACDAAENYGSENNNGLYYVYPVIHEFPSIIMLLVFLTATLLVIIAYKKKPLSQNNS